MAINKCDKPGADVERTKQGLLELSLVPEEWGGTTPMVAISAKKGTGAAGAAAAAAAAGGPGAGGGARCWVLAFGGALSLVFPFAVLSSPLTHLQPLPPQRPNPLTHAT